MNHFTGTFCQLLLPALLIGCSSSENDSGDVDYIESYIHSQHEFDFPAAMESFKQQRKELLRLVAVGDRVSHEIDRLWNEPGGTAKLKRYVEGLTPAKKSTPEDLIRFTNEMKGHMSEAVGAFAVHMAVMTVTEEICRKPEAAEKWQDFFIRLVIPLKVAAFAVVGLVFYA